MNILLAILNKMNLRTLVIDIGSITITTKLSDCGNGDAFNFNNRKRVLNDQVLVLTIIYVIDDVGYWLSKYVTFQLINI